jgi:hypothetical protein
LRWTQFFSPTGANKFRYFLKSRVCIIQGKYNWVPSKHKVVLHACELAIAMPVCNSADSTYCLRSELTAG